MKICIISVEKDDYAPQHLLKAALNNNHDAYITTWDSLALTIDRRVSFSDKTSLDLSNFDAILPRNPQYHQSSTKLFFDFHYIFHLVAQFSKERGIYFLNQKYFSEYQSHNKLSQQYHFKINNLPGIPTYTEPPSVYPYIAKDITGSLGRDITMIHTKKDLVSTQQKTKEILLYQKYIPYSHDYRILVIGGKSIGAIERIPQNGEWRANVSIGAKTIPIYKDDKPDLYSLAERTAKVMHLDYAGIDILQSHDGALHIIETNSLPQFEGFEKAFPNIDVGKEIIRFIETKVGSN